MLIPEAENIDPTPSIPEKNLLAAVLGRAILDATGTVDLQARKGAHMWLRLDREFSDKFEPFSFRWICFYLDLDPRIIKKYVLLEINNPQDMGINLRYARHRIRSM